MDEASKQELRRKLSSDVYMGNAVDVIAEDLMHGQKRLVDLIPQRKPKDPRSQAAYYSRNRARILEQAAERRRLNGIPVATKYSKEEATARRKEQARRRRNRIRQND